MTQARSTFQHARIADGNGSHTTYWGINLSTIQLVLGLIVTLLTIIISASVLVGPWINYKAETAAAPLIDKASEQLRLEHEKDLDRVREILAEANGDRDEIIRRLERIEAKIDNHIAAYK